MSAQQQTIKWGDILRIHGVSIIKDNPVKGLIISKGFTNPNVYYQTYENYDEVNFYRQSLFQILPRSNFDLHDQLLFDENITPQMKDSLRQRTKEQIDNLYHALQRKYSDKTHPQLAYVTYGAEVVFKHIESGQYLMGVLKAADIGQGAFKLQLSKDLNNYVVFNLVSHRSYQQIGNKIYYDDCLRIHHVKSDCYMNFPNTKSPIIYDMQYTVAKFEKEDPGYEYAQNRPSIKKPVGIRINVINENRSKCLWKFIQHCRYAQSNAKQTIKSHDIVYFQHTKNQGLVASTLARKKYYLKELVENNAQSISYQCFWELIPKQGNETGPQKFNTFWARNIVTGQILVYQDFKVQIQSKQKMQSGGFVNGGLVNLICGIEQRQDKKLQPKKYLLQKGQIIANDDKVEEVIKYFDSNIRKYEFRKVQQLTGDSFVIFKVSQQTILDVSYVLSSQQIFVKVVEIISTQLKKKTSNPDITWKDMFMNINQDLLASFISVLKLLSGKIYGTSYDNIEASGNSPIVQVQKILVQTGIAQLIIELIFTLYEPFLQILNNKDIEQDRSIRLKVAQIFELLYTLAQKIVKNFLENKIFLSRWVKIFLDHSNNINKPFIQQTLVSILQNNSVSIKSMINVNVIDNIIKNFFTQANNSPEDLPTKHLRLFSTFIRGDNTIFKENQKQILNRFFLIEDNQYTFRFKVQYRISDEEQNLSDEYRDKQRNKIVKVIFKKSDEPTTIPQFIELYPNRSNYLLSYINLLADVCMDKNNQAIQYVQSALPLAVVTNVLFDPQIIFINKRIQQSKSIAFEKPVDRRSSINQIPKQAKLPSSNLHEPFIRIAHYAYVNNFKFSPIRRIRKVVKWYKQEQQEKFISQNEDITRTKRVYQGQKQQEQKNYLRSLLDYIKKFLKEKYDKDINTLQILHTVLQFLRETILLGLWDSIDQFREIVPLLINNITKIQCGAFFQGYTEKVKSRYNGKDWVDINKESLKMDRPEINLIIQCKIKASQIFKYINQMELDIRLRYMMNFFQGIYDASQNFENYSQDIKQYLNLDEIQDQQKKSQVEERNTVAKKLFYKVSASKILGNDFNKLCQNQDMMLKQIIWYNKIKTMIPLAGQFQKAQQPEKDRNLFKTIQQPEYNQIILSLFELSGYNNKDLLNSSLNMLKVMFNQRNDLIYSFNNILICGKGNLNEVYSNLKFMRNKFAMLQNDIIIGYDGNANKSFPYAIFKPYDHLGRQQDKRSGIIQDLFFLSRTLKDKVSLKNIQSLMHVQKEVFDKNIVYHFYNEKQKNNNLFQQLNLAEGIYDPLLSYIKIIGNQQLPQIHRKLLFSIYQYLTLLCFNNVKAKILFMNYISYIIPHLSKRVGAASFLYEVCINNKILVHSEKKVRQIIEGVLDSCNILQNEEIVHTIVSDAINQDINIHDNYEKSRLLYCLRGILIFNDEGHKLNQQLLMNKLQDNKYRRLIFSGSLKQFNAKRQQFNLNPIQSYASTNFQLFSALVQSQNLINIGKLQNLHPYTYCLKKLEETNRWQIRRSLRSYINRLYYVNKDRDTFLFEQFIRNQFNIINKQLLDLIELHKSKMLTGDLKVKNGIRFVYAQSQITFSIMQILITLNEIFLKNVFIQVLKRQLAKQQKLEDAYKKLHKSIITLLQNLGCINKLYQTTKTLDNFIKQIKKSMTIIMRNFHVRYLEKMSQPQLQRKPQQDQQNKQQSTQAKPHKYDQSRTFFTNLVSMIKSLKRQQTHNQSKEQYMKRKNRMDLTEDQLKQKHIEVIFAQSGKNLRPLNSGKVKQPEQFHYKPHLQTANSNILKVLAKPQLEQNQENLQLNQRLNFVKDVLNDSPIFKKLKEDQFYTLIKIFTKMDGQSSQIYAPNWKQLSQEPRPVFSTKEIITSIFSLIMHNPDKINDEEKIFTIKLARCYITEAVEENQIYKLEVDKWSADYYTDDFNGSDILAEDRSQLVKRQHLIEQCGGSQFLLSIFKQNLLAKTDTNLLNQVLLFGIAYLFNGNTHCQNSILSNLKKDTYNITFQNIKQLIRSIGEFLKNVRKFKQNEKNRQFSFKIVDSYDHFDLKQNILTKQFGHKTDKFEIQTQLDYEKALCRIFRFLQLFCQNNNIQMKKFVMAQTDQEGKLKANTINFITQTTQLLRQFFKIMSSKVVDIPPSLLDFLNQITQIPCIDCQKSLMRSTFFEDISYMAGFFESVENIQQRKFNFYIEDKPRNPEQQKQEEQNEDPLVILANIYQKGIGLALSNFQGNEQQIYYEFINKSQPKLLWIVIRQNLIKLLKPYAVQFFKVKKENIQQQFQNKHKQKQTQQQKQKQTIQQKQARIVYKKYKQFLVEYEFIRRILERFDEKTMLKFINLQKSLSPLYNEEILNIINTLALLKRLDDYATNKEALLKNMEQIKPEDSDRPYKAKRFKRQLIQYAQKDRYPHISQFIGYFNDLILQIQVASDNGLCKNVQNLYFPNHPVFSYLASDTRDTIMSQVGRQTRRDKLINLFDHYEELKQQIQSNYQLKYYQFNLGIIKFPFQITSQYTDTIRKTARYISYLICALMLAFIIVDHDMEQQTSFFSFFYSYERIIMRILTTLQLLATFLFLSLWIKMRLNLSLSKLKKSQQQVTQQAAGQQQEIQQQAQKQQTVPGTIIQKIFYYAVKISKIYFFTVKKITKTIKYVKNKFIYLFTQVFGFRHITKLIFFILQPIYNFIKYILICLYALNQYQSGFLAILVFVVAAIMGNFVGIQWYVIHLFDYFVGISLLTNVFKAVIDNIRQLTLLTAFATCFILVFNVISLNTYTSVVYEDDLPEQSCQTVIDCVMVLYTSGAIGDDMDQIYFGRFSFDMVYFIFMEILFSNLISGIMIDGFGALKEADAAINDDKKSNCYICGLQKAEMQKTGTTFKKHTQKLHFLWNYMFYKYVLFLKDPSDYTGLEYNIATQITGQQIDWFPDNGPKDEAGQIETLMNNIKQKVVRLNENLNNMISKNTDQIKSGSKVIQAVINRIKQSQPVPAIQE